MVRLANKSAAEKKDNRISAKRILKNYKKYKGGVYHEKT